MEMARELALEAPEGLHPCLALGFLAFEVCLGGGVPASACDRDDVQRAIEASVAAAVQPVAFVFARGRGDRALSRIAPRRTPPREAGRCSDRR